ncbi:MAG: group 1 glycosyl transferase [Acidobacteria bacterium OLB17]|nr:MAG: group 1 glycosyl transferase [Acidobacteria bacterium OLB17]MCZ2390294.1 glycosyltransferase [Acidobacteriota bacterium]
MMHALDHSAERVRFCHLLDSCTPNPLLFTSIKYSDRERFDYQVITLRSDDGLTEQMAEIGVPVRTLNYTTRKDAVGALFKLYSIFRKERPKIVQTHLFDSSLIGLTAARLAGVPVTVFTGHHSSEIPFYTSKVLTFLDGSSGRFLSKHTIAPSVQMKDTFVGHLKVPEKKVSVLYHGFDLAAWKRSARPEAQIREELKLTGKIVFGSVGRLYRLKNFENLIRGFAAFSSDRDDTALVIVGAGDQTSLRQLAGSLGLSEKVVFTGSRTDIAAVMNSFDVLVHPSLAESFGMVFIEAFALGKPILSTPVGVAPEVIVDGENGFFLKDGEPVSIAEGFRKIITERHRWSKMGENGAAAAEKFEIRKTQSLCDEMYLQWLKEDSRRDG